MSVEKYTGLITSEHFEKPNFKSLLGSAVSPLSRIQDVLSSMVPLFDLDVALGDQLDVIGEWVGVMRNVPIPITGVYFEWENAPVGWELGTWKGDFDPSTGPTLLPDDAYRSLIKAKIAANSWDGSIPGAYAIYAQLFPGGGIVIQDNQDMTMVIGFFGPPPSAIIKALIVGGFFTLKPEGVGIAFYAFPTNNGPLFGWDIESTAIQGWGEGDWAITLV